MKTSITVVVNTCLISNGNVVSRCNRNINTDDKRSGSCNADKP